MGRATTTERGSRKGKGETRQESRRFASNVSLGMIAIGLVVGLVAIANRWTSREPLRAVVVDGTHVLRSSEVLEQAELPDSARVKGIDLDEIERRLLSHPFIEKAMTYYDGDGRLVFEINERSPVAATVIDGKPVYIDHQGVLLPFRFGSIGPDVPIVRGVLDSNRIDSTRGLEALGVIEELRRYDETLYRRISEVERDENGLYTFLLTDDGVPVIAGRADEIAPRLPKLEGFLEQVVPVRGTASLRSIDLRWDGQVVVRWRSAGGSKGGEA